MASSLFTPVIKKYKLLMGSIGGRVKERLFRYKRLSAEEFLAQKKSSAEVYRQLVLLTGEELLHAAAVKRLCGYVNDWEPFVVETMPLTVWDEHALQVDRDTGAIALPHPFISPTRKESTNRHQWQKKQFYWDMYFINKGLLATEDPKFIAIAKGHIENFQYLFDRLGYIPNASDTNLLNRSQIPFLTGMIFDIYYTTKDTQWLKEKIAFAKREYDQWMATQEELLQKGSARVSHRIRNDSLLIRPVGRDIEKEHYTAAAETGEDDSGEWARRAYEYIPVSLNCALYQYEKDFAKAADILESLEEKNLWEQRAKSRADEINKALWDKNSGRYVNAMIDRETNQWVLDTQYHGLTSFMPLWAGIARPEQAERAVTHLAKFEAPYGLLIATRDSSPSTVWVKRRIHAALLGKKKWQRYESAIEDLLSSQQWDYPNVWAPMAYFATEGLLQYGKIAQARRVLENSLRGLAAFFAEHGTLPEKHNGLTGKGGTHFYYPNQEGFGWVNAWAQHIVKRLENFP